ncbi:nitroreductase/quinone reductase family protein [Microbacterium sp. ASV49]|uniref:Nitroreductase/quinone reductase family protein n=1 Tax=Microbacterium candidum TaxID=3041922 RepID=A0ABT7MU24_9MICO|nr:nitroreductase/quinone reductase family protein [Microbacterium sp. ASV49]MDL9977946.1 nitroreductase/quinone reductase family protein [Microbacterium sp. ASV49]
MSDASGWTDPTIAEFRANKGKVGGYFEGKHLVLMHHRGRKSGHERVTPAVYLPNEADPSSIYVFATKGGSPDNPGWYYNLVDAGTATVEVGEETYPVTVHEVTGADRDRIYAEQVRAVPSFGEYEVKTAGIRTIPVLELRRA